MKPLKISISAFGPYSDQVDIDFDRLGDSGLFLVTGDTGAGKTTIFDAICFALFGEMSGVYREGSMMRSDFAKAETRTFVKLEFLYKNKKYCVERNPAYERPKLRSEGFTKELPNATLNFPDGRVVSSFGSVTSEIEKILGINKNQFSQIAMIAQGDFLRLLLADSKDRSAIFRKVFSTDFYERFQIELKDQSLQMKNAYDTLSQQIVQLLCDVTCAEEDASFERFAELKTKKSIHEFSEMTALLATILTEDQKRLHTENTAIQHFQREIERMILEINKAYQDNQKLKAFQKIKSDFKTLSDQRESNQTKANQVKDAEKALHFVKPVEVRMRAAQDKLVDTLERIESYNATIKRLSSDVESHTKGFQLAKSKDPERVQLSSDIAVLADALPMYEALSELESKVQIQTKTIETKLAMATSLQAEKEALETKIRNIQDANEGLLDAEETVHATLRLLDTAKNTRQQLLRLIVNSDKLNAAKVVHEEVIRELQVGNQDLNVKKETHHMLEQHFFAEQAGILAEQLIDQTPCPVCGSLEHPNPAPKGENAPTKEALDKAKRQMEVASNQTNALSVKVGSLKQSIETMQTDLFVEAKPLLGIEIIDEILPKLLIEKNSIETDIVALEAAYALKNKQVETLKSNRLTLVANSKEHQTLLEAIKEGEETLNELKIAMTQDASQAHTIRARLKYGDHQEAMTVYDEKLGVLDQLRRELELSESNLLACKNELNKANAAHDELNLSLVKESEARDVLEKEFEVTLQRHAFIDEGHYRSKLLSDAAISALKLEVDRFEEQFNAVNAEMKHLHAETENLSTTDIATLEEARRSFEREKAEAEQRKMVIYSRIEYNLKIDETLRLRKNAIDRLESKYLTIKNLSDTANGSLQGKQRLAFERYIQAYYFNHILIKANERFSYMTNNRFKLVRKDEATNLMSQSGLEIDVMDHYTGKSRSVKSLSGGESFKASLSLALGLSEMIQSHKGGVQLDTMFVDEGFGSLDSESLEQAIDVLNALTHGDRLVGIISHVSELREKIDRKIVVKKGNTGSYVELV